MSQMTFAEAEIAHKKHKTRREIFLQRMDQLTQWSNTTLRQHHPCHHHRSTELHEE